MAWGGDGGAGFIDSCPKRERGVVPFRQVSKDSVARYLLHLGCDQCCEVAWGDGSADPVVEGLADLCGGADNDLCRRDVIAGTLSVMRECQWVLYPTGEKVDTPPPVAVETSASHAAPTYSLGREAAEITVNHVSGGVSGYVNELWRPTDHSGDSVKKQQDSLWAAGQGFVTGGVGPSAGLHEQG